MSRKSTKTTLMNETDWVAEHLSGIPESWENLVLEGHVDFDTLEDGPLKIALTTWEDAQVAVEHLLESLEYEPG